MRLTFSEGKPSYTSPYARIYTKPAFLSYHYGRLLRILSPFLGNLLQCLTTWKVLEPFSTLLEMIKLKVFYYYYFIKSIFLKMKRSLLRMRKTFIQKMTRLLAKLMSKLLPKASLWWKAKENKSKVPNVSSQTRLKIHSLRTGDIERCSTLTFVVSYDVSVSGVSVPTVSVSTAWSGSDMVDSCELFSRLFVAWQTKPKSRT